MKRLGSVIGGWIAALVRARVEGQARGRSWSDLAHGLERSGESLAERLGHARDTPRQREAANHIVGIERWGRRRLRVPLGEPFVLDGHRPYRLPESATMPELHEAFVRTRADTVALARELEAKGIDIDVRVRHNDLGELTLGAWLAYLDGHAQREAIRLFRRR